MTSAQLRCLLACQELCPTGESIASKEIAVHLHLSRPSVHRLLEALVLKGLVEKEPYGTVSFSERGRLVAASVKQKHERMLEAVRGISELSEAEAEEGAYLLVSCMDFDS
ncbi:MAG: MarR family transcriptional regulator [Clostridia bacterium]|nr:MarR family transcriptional regulator [Clostridia bacterium]